MKFSKNTKQNCREHNQEWTKLEKIKKRLNNATASYGFKKLKPLTFIMMC